MDSSNNLIQGALLEKLKIPLTKVCANAEADGLQLKAVITYFRAIDQIYVVPCPGCGLAGFDLDSMDQKLNELMNESNVQETGFEKGKLRPILGELVVVKLGILIDSEVRDLGWRRGVVTKVPPQRTEPKLEIVLIDYGKPYKVPLDRIFKLPQELVKIPPLAYRCGLNSLKGSTLDGKSCQELDKTFSGKIVRVDLLSNSKEDVLNVVTPGIEYFENQPYYAELRYYKTGLDGKNDFEFLSFFIARDWKMKLEDPLEANVYFEVDAENALEKRKEFAAKNFEAHLKLNLRK